MLKMSDWPSSNLQERDENLVHTEASNIIKIQPNQACFETLEVCFSYLSFLYSTKILLDYGVLFLSLYL